MSERTVSVLDRAKNTSKANSRMDVTNRIFSAEQIVVPPDLPGVLKDWTKEVIRKNPTDLLKFSAEYFADRAEASRKGKLPLDELKHMRNLFDKYDTDGNGKMESKEFKSFIKTGTSRTDTDRTET